MPPYNISEQQCQQWRLHPNINPITNRIIEVDGDVYRQFVRTCGAPTAIPFTSGTARPNTDTIWRNFRENTPILPVPEGPPPPRRSARIAAQTQVPINAQVVTPAPVATPAPPAPAPRRRTTRVTPVAQTTPVTLAPVNTYTPLTLETISTLPLEELVINMVPRFDRAAMPNNAIAEMFQGVTSRYEIERYISHYLQRGIDMYIHPVTGEAQYNVTPALKRFLQSLCMVGRVPYGKVPYETHTIVTRGSSYEFRKDRVIVREVRRNGTMDNEMKVYMLADLCKFADSVRRSDVTANLMHPTENRAVVVSENPDSEFASLVFMCYEAGLDMLEMVYRVNPDIPVIAMDTLTPGSKAEIAWRAYRAIYPETNHEAPPSASPLTKAILMRMHEAVRAAIVNDRYPGTVRSNQGASMLESKAKTVVTTPTSSPTDVHPTCVQTLNGLDEYFKPFVRKLKKICTSMSKSCGDMTKIQKDLFDIVERNPIHNNYRLQMRNIEPDYVLAELFFVWNSIQGEKRAKSLYITLGAFMGVTYKGQEGVGVGVMRSFIQRLMDELEIYGVFAPYPGNASNRYFINPAFTPDQKFKNIADLPFRTEADYRLFYEFVGQLLIAVLMNPTSLPFQLSYSILAHMLYKHTEITPDDYVGYYMMDFPDEFVGLANLMRNAETIEHVGMEFRDEFNLKLPAQYENEDNAPITKENYREYLQKRAEYRYLHNLYPREMRREGWALDVYDRMLSLAKGFDKMRKVLRHNSVTIQTIDKLISANKMSPEVIQALVTKFQDVARERANTGTGTAQLTELTNLIVRILQDEGETYPYDVQGIERPTTKEERVRIHSDFVSRLLMFWSSYRVFRSNFNYIVTIQRPENMDAGRRIARRRPLTDMEEQEILPEAHTCFQRIDIPSTYANNQEKLYRKLVQASSMVETGIGNYGGSKKEKKYRKLTLNHKTK